MSRFFFTLMLLTASLTSAWATDPVPNHIRHPLHPGLADKHGMMRMTVVEKPRYVPTLAPGGLSNQNTITGAAGAPLLDDVWNYADNSVQQDDVGTTVAPLNDSGNMTSPLAAGGPSTIANENGDVVVSFAPRATGLSQDNWAMNNSLLKPNAMVIGGARAHMATPIIDYNTDGQLWVLGQTDGSNSLGCLLCIVQTTHSITHTMAGLSGTWANGPSGIAGYGEADAAVFYTQAQNNVGTLTLSPSSVTATQIILSTPLTPSEMARIHYGQYVLSNFVDSSQPVPVFSDTAPLPSKNFYASVVDHVVDSTHIQIKGWAVPGAGNSSKGQIPDITKLDTVWTNFGVPTVGIGSFTNNMWMNLRYDVGAQNSWNRGFENEWDFTDRSGVSGGHRKRVLTITDQSGVRPSADSWVFYLNTIQYPVQIHMETRPDGYGIQSNSFMTKGNKGVGTVGDTWEMAESAAFSDSVDNMRLVSAVSKDSSATGYTGTSVHLGLIPNAHQGTWSTPQNQIIFGPLLPGQTKNSPGAIALAGFAGIGLVVDSNANTLLPQGHFMQFQPTNWIAGSSAPILQAVSPSQLNVRDTGGNGIILDTYNLNVGGTATISSAQVAGNVTLKGQLDFSSIGVFFNPTSSTKLELLNAAGNNVTLSAARFKSSLATPTSSSSPCSAGEFTADQNYHYVCTAPNHWRRVALSDF